MRRLNRSCDLTTFLSSSSNQCLLTTQLHGTDRVLWQIPHQFFYMLVSVSFWTTLKLHDDNSQPAENRRQAGQKNAGQNVLSARRHTSKTSRAPCFWESSEFSSVTRGSGAVEGIKVMSRHKYNYNFAGDNQNSGHSEYKHENKSTQTGWAALLSP